MRVSYEHVNRECFCLHSTTREGKQWSVVHPQQSLPFKECRTSEGFFAVIISFLFQLAVFITNSNTNYNNIFIFATKMCMEALKETQETEFVM